MYLPLVHRVGGRSDGGVPALSYRKHAAWPCRCSCCSCSFCCFYSCYRLVRRSAAAPWPTTSPAPLRSCFGTTGPRPPSPLGAQVTFCSPSKAGCWGHSSRLDTQSSLRPNAASVPRTNLPFSTMLLLSIYTKCVLCVVRDYVQNFYMPCPYMLSVDDFRYNVSLCLGKPPLCVSLMGFMALVP